MPHDLSFKQVYNLVNAITGESVGGENITVKDTASLVSLGNIVLSSDDNVDEFYKKLVPVIGRIATHYQAIRRRTRGIERNPIEFGIAVLEYERRSIARAKKNDSWVKPSVNPFTVIPEDDTDFECHVYSLIAGWQINKKVYDYQLKTAFHNEAEMANFIGMVFQDMYDGMTQAQNDNDAITECTAMAQSLLATTWNNPKKTAYNFWTLFKQRFPSSTLTFAECRNDSTFLKFCGALLRNVIKDASGQVSNLFNAGGVEAELDSDYKIHVLSEFASDMSYYLEADTYHNELVALPNYEEITSWQGFGGSATFDEKSTIAITNEDITVVQSGIVAHVFASGRMMTMIDRIRTKSVYDPDAECTDYFHKADIGSLIRRNDIGIVFYIAEADFDNNFLRSLTLSSNVPDSDLYGKTLNELQSNIQFNGEYAIGTLKHVTGYTGFSGESELQSGNYIAIKVDLFGIPATANPTIIVTKSVTGEEDTTTTISDGYLVCRVPDNTTKLVFTASASGYTAVTKTVKMSRLTLLTE